MVRAEMAQQFIVTGIDTPPWDNPHPLDVPVLEEEYSRLLDPGKYRILATRVDAWAAALERLGLGVVERPPVGRELWRDPPRSSFDRAVRVRPVRAGAMPLLFGFDAIDDVPDTGLTIGVGEPAVEIGVLPDCGCDACDYGSEELQAELDAALTAVVGGHLIHLTTPDGTVIATDQGLSAQGDIVDLEDLEELVAEARAGRSRAVVVSGVAWW